MGFSAPHFHKVSSGLDRILKSKHTLFGSRARPVDAIPQAGSTASQKLKIWPGARSKTEPGYQRAAPHVQWKCPGCPLWLRQDGQIEPTANAAEHCFWVKIVKTVQLQVGLGSESRSRSLRLPLIMNCSSIQMNKDFHGANTARCSIKIRQIGPSANRWFFLKILNQSFPSFITELWFYENTLALWKGHSSLSGKKNNTVSCDMKDYRFAWGI